MSEFPWYPGNYTGFGVEDSRIYLLPSFKVLCVLAKDIDTERADPIVMACGLRPSGNGGECWCVAPLMEQTRQVPPFPNACFATLDEVEHYLSRQNPDPLPAVEPISEDEVFRFIAFLEEGFSLPE